MTAPKTPEAWLLDTNVVSEMRKGARADPGVRAWSSQTPQQLLFLGVLTMAEIRVGIEAVARHDFRDELRRWLEALRVGFAGRILPVTEDILMRWRQLSIAGQRAGLTPSQPDALLAATASEHGLGVATRNTGDFEQFGVAVLNPWSTRPRR